MPDKYILEMLCDYIGASKAYNKGKYTDENPLKGFKDYELQRLDRDIAWMREGSKLDPEYVKLCKANFYRFFNEHDKRRGTNFLTTFPEMTEWWKQCEYYAKTT